MSKTPEGPESPRSAGNEERFAPAGAMGALRNPIGPKSRGVYLRRRILVLAGLVAVIAVVVLVFLKPGSSGSARDASQVEVPSDLPREETVADGEVAACADGQLTVVPATDKTDYVEGEEPQLSLVVENTGTEACSADLGTAGMTFTITSGEDQIWRSTDCQENPESLAVILDPGKPLTSEALPWVRERSDPSTCGVEREKVPAGGASYHLTATVGGVSSVETAQFLLF